ncbi:hypothetical protein H0H87_001476 [Tephrocybe sp. NHM501043]|nr:hypothetical protein H0H87_001476 [Tephrocybe sp. NHM501043]
MSKYLGAARRRTAVEKVLTLFIESGFVYIVIYTLQAVPIYGAKLSSSGLIAFNVVNAVIQQAMGMYPTVIIILVRMHKSLWDTKEVSQGIYSTKINFRSGPSMPGESDDVTETAVASDYATRYHQDDTFAMVDLNRSGEITSENNSKTGVVAVV